MNSRRKVLVIAGSDSSGGAGLLRDVQVLSELGVDAACAVTAVTAQSHHRVEVTCAIDPSLVHKQIRAAFDSGVVHAIKIGMLCNSSIVAAVAAELPSRNDIPIVLDPVLFSSSGIALLDSEGFDALQGCLLSRCSLLTPNLIEAAALLNQPVAATNADRMQQARELLHLGPSAVLIKGGHALDGSAADLLVQSGSAPLWLQAERVNASLRGTGCALSSAIAAQLARGDSFESACRAAKAYVFNKLRLMARTATSARPPAEPAPVR